MRSLDSILGRAFENCTHYTYYRHYSGIFTPSLTMKIPVFTKNFEVPVFALSGFNSILLSNNPNYNAIAVLLRGSNARSTYKSIDTIMRDILGSSSNCSYLTKIVLDNTDTVYYGTSGAIFDANLIPLMMMTWQIEKVREAEDSTKPLYKYKRPLLRISPTVFVNKDTQVLKYIANRVFSKTLLLNDICIPYINCELLDGSNRYHSFSPKVEIDDCPFTLRYVDTPSVSTTNEELLKLILDNIDEVIK